MTYSYFDHNATTAVADAVLDAMMPYFRKEYGNPSSRHGPGIAVRRAVDRARGQVAESVGVQPAQVVFASGGSEANNLFIQGAAGYLKPACIAVSAIEHPCVMRTAQELTRNGQGWSLRRLAVDSLGRVDPDDVDRAMVEQRPGLVSVMLANNETGVIQDVSAIAGKAREQRAWIHTDAVQAFGKIPVDFASLNVHAMTLSAHKVYGPKGAAALIVDKRLLLKPLIYGGGHENGLRSGTGAWIDRNGCGDFRTGCRTLAQYLLFRPARDRGRYARGSFGQGGVCGSKRCRLLQREPWPQPCAGGNGSRPGIDALRGQGESRYR